MAGYRIELEPDDNGTLLVTCPALPEVATYGVDQADAEDHASDAIEEALAARISDSRDIPPPDAWPPAGGSPFARLPMLTAMKIELYRGLREAGITRAELSRRLECNRESVDRLFRLDHGSKLDQIEAAFQALGLRVGVEVRSVAA